MDSPLSDFKDEIGERFLETGKKAVKTVIKGAVQSVKGQIVGRGDNKPNEVQQDNKSNKKIDPITGRPVISKRVLTQLNQQVAQLAQMRMKKVREELEKQRLQEKQVEQEKQAEQEKAKEDVISKVLKASKSTGEFGKNIGG